MSATGRTGRETGGSIGGKAMTGVSALLFDLDGTLVDSVPDIARAANLLLETEGLEPLGVDEVRAMVGHGIPTLVGRVFIARGRDLDAAAHAAMTARMMGIYADNLTGLTVPLPGALDVLEGGARAGLKLAVVTNKPEAFSREILAHFGMDAHVASVVGGDTCATCKPEPEMLLHAAAALGVSVDDAVMVGDSSADVASARAAGMRVVVVRGGYTSVPAEELGADLVIDGLADLLALFDGQPAPA
ncbi:phosphoglycolate phosphatase [Stappia sp.]|uniref:phosphoglycolate phosphatase n=1 Tax=Stappia sp. TaxID=1870903 RepID=UPI003A99A11A